MTRKIDNKGYDPLTVTVDKVIRDNRNYANNGFTAVEGYGRVLVVKEAQPKEARPERTFPVVRIRL